jgi:site-specific DNA recombinase
MMKRERAKKAEEQARPLRAAGYARVSTREQAEGGHSLAEQEQAIRAYVKQRGWELAAMHIDAGCSGSNLQRAGLQALLAQVESREVDVAVATKLDRLSRSALDLLRLREVFTDGPELAFAHDQIDTTCPTGRLTFTILAGAAEHFLDLLRQNTCNGMAQAKAEGHIAGRAPFGWRREGGALVKDSEQQKALARARRLRRQGLSIRAVAATMGWGRTATAYRLGWRPTR